MLETRTVGLFGMFNVNLKGHLLLFHGNFIEYQLLSSRRLKQKVSICCYFYLLDCHNTHKAIYFRCTYLCVMLGIGPES